MEFHVLLSARFQLPANTVLGGQQSQVIESLPPVWDIWIEFLAPGFGPGPNSGCCGYLGNEHAVRGVFSPPLPLHLPVLLCFVVILPLKSKNRWMWGHIYFHIL